MVIGERLKALREPMSRMNLDFAPNYTTARLASGLITILVILVGSAFFVRAQQEVGYVLEKEGKWTARGAVEGVNMGQPLAGGTLLTNSSPTDNDHIVVANLRGEIVKTIRCRSGVCRECRESGACYDPIQPLPILSDSTGALSTAFKAVSELFAGKPDRYSIHRVRGSGNVITKNGIVRFDGSAIDVSNFLEGEDQGLYEVQFFPLSAEGNAIQEPKSHSTSLNWSPAGKATLAVAGVHPGLYEMRITHGNESSSVWVLVCSSAFYVTSAASFQAFVHQTDSWGANVSQATKQAYQRAFLEYLASRSE